MVLVYFQAFADLGPAQVPLWVTISAKLAQVKVGLGQNGQILFISVEQLSLNVADDSAKTLSVLENMGFFSMTVASDFFQNCRRPSQNTTDFGGPTDFFEILPKKIPTEIIPNR